MSIRIDVFIFDEDSITKIPYPKFQRLVDNHETEKLLEHAGKKLKFAIVYVKTRYRKPVEILHSDFGFAQVMPNGKFDQELIRQQKIDAMKVIPIPDFNSPENVIDESHTFASKMYRNKYVWTPTSDEKKKLNQIVFSSITK